MQYTRPSFSTAVSNGSISDTAYEVAVGLRCAHCLRFIVDGHKRACVALTSYYQDWNKES